MAPAKYQAGIWVICVVILDGINGSALGESTPGSLHTAACLFAKQLWI